MMNKYTWNIVAAIALLCLYGVQTNAQAKKDTLRILFVGNSYTYFENLPQVVSVLSGKTGTILLTEQVTIGGAKLSEHWRGARRTQNQG
ncbi:MAG: hypothetical protein IPI37_02970 [Bacteroidales bacterium]|nr:hypothetical protein [Bacteroidales bacterium]